MRTHSFLFCFMLFSVLAFGQTTENKTNDATTSGSSSLPPIQYYILGGSVGAGGVVSTDVINSGAVLPASLEILLQMKRKRLGFGLTHELYLTPENLGKLILGNSSNTEKFYFVWEGTVFKNSPINLGYSGQFGGFLVGNERDAGTTDKTRWFVNMGGLVEFGLPRLFLYVRPAIEYKSYDTKSWHKEILATASLGLRYKFLTEEEKQRRGKK